MSARDFSERSAAFHREHFPDADELSGPATVLLLRLANVLRADTERQVLRGLGLRWTAYTAVFALRLFDTLEAPALARVTGVSRQAISLVLTTLERDGLIRRCRGEDRRRLTVSLTPHGRAVAEQAVTGQVEVADDALGCLTPDERQQLVGLLQRVLESRQPRA